MAVESDLDRAQYATNGTTGPWTVPFYFLADTDLAVTYTDANAVDYALTLNVDFSVSGAGVSSGGTITTTAAYASGGTITILRDMEIVQETVYVDGDPFPAKTHERALDRLTMIGQQLRELFGRAVAFPPSYDGSANLADAATRAGKMLGFDTVTGALTYITIAAGSALELASGLASSTGTTLLGYLAPYTGARQRTQAAKNADTISALEFTGVDNTGTTDSTAGLINAMIAARVQSPGKSKRLLIPSGTYKVSNTIGAGSYVSIICEPNVIIDASGLPNETTSLFAISNQDRFYFEGNGAVLKGSRATATPSVEGNQAAFFVYGSDNVWIRDVTIQDFATDGITLTGDNAASGPCTNVRIDGVICTNNRRNGLSVIHAKGVTVNGGEYNASNGAPNGPWAGIDIEPNAHEYCQGIKINNVRTSNNAAAGILMVPAAQSVDAGTTFSATVDGWESVNDGLVGAAAVGKSALLFASGSAWANKVYGQIVVENAVIRLPKWAGVSQQNWDADLAPHVLCRNIRVYDPDGTISNPDNAGRVGFLIYANSAFSVTTIGNMTFENCYAEDTRGTVRMTGGFLVDASSACTVKRVRFRNPRAVNFTGTAKLDVNVSAPLTGAINEVSVWYDAPSLTTALTGSTNITNWVGKRVTSNGAGATYTLPALAKSVGAVYEIYFTSAATTNTVTAAASETIKPNGAAAALTQSPAAGDTWRYWNPDGTHWVASQIA